MQQKRWMRFWDIIYPIFMYFAFSTTALVLLDFILPRTIGNSVLRQMISSVAALLFLVPCYRRDQKKRGEKPRLARPLDGALCLVFGGCFGSALNYVLGILRLAEYSSAYDRVEQNFYTGKILLEIMALCIIIPIAEELLYRGIVYGRLKEGMGARRAAIFSALIFGIIHMNLVQFIYASLFGVLLAYLTERTGSVICPTAAHMAANLFSVLRAETGLFDFLETSAAVLAVATVCLFGVSFLCIRQVGLRNQDTPL